MRPHGIGNRQRRARPRRRDIRLLLDRVLDAEGCDRPVDVSFVGPRAMSRLHGRFMGLPGPTDVLSFPLGAPPPGADGAPIGDLVICVEVCERSAAARGIDLHREIARMLIHGALHLLGFDHGTRRQADRMRPRERRHMAWYRRSGLRVVY